MAAFTKGGEARVAGTDAPGRPYAVHTDEISRPGEAKRPDADLRLWIFLGLIGQAFLFKVYVWPRLHEAIYRPTPLRNYLLPRSADPLYVIAGQGVGWFWVLFIAAPVLSAVLALGWWASLAAENKRIAAGAGNRGQTRAGKAWKGQTYPSGPMILAAAAAVLAAAGVLLRWAGPVAATLIGRLLLVALLGLLGFGFVEFARWARARARITRRANEATSLLSPALGWPDIRSRVHPRRCCYPRGEQAFPRTVLLHYGQHSRTVGEELFAEICAVLGQVFGRTYTVSGHDPLANVITAVETAPAEVDIVSDAEAVLVPLVAAWFDPAARITAVLTDAEKVSPAELDSGEQGQVSEHSAATEHDTVAAAICGFTVEFVYNLRTSSSYRRGVIEGAVSDALGGSWEAEWSLPSRRVRFTRCPGLPTLVDPPLDFPAVTRAAIRKVYQKTVIPFAVDAYGNVVGWDFRQSPHMLVAGATSTGKTSLLMTIATQCAVRGINVVWVDPKGFDSPGMRNWPNVSLVTAGTDEDGMVGHTAVLRFLADTMRDRLSQVKINPNRADDFDPIVLITDEFSNLVVALAEFYGTYRAKWEKGTAPTTIDVGILLRTARAVGIHMALGIQRPDTMFIAGEARDNTALRVAMGRLRSKEAAVMMFNDPVAGTRLQPGIKGRGTVQLPDGTFREIQAFYTPKVPATPEQRNELSEHERGILDALSAVDSFWPRRVIDSALRDYDPADEEDGDPKSLMSFAKIRESPIVLAADRPDLDPLSEQYVVPGGALRRPTMDDDHTDPDREAGVDDVVVPVSVVSTPFGGPVDGWDDEYLPGVDEEYGPSIPVTADELRHGDLVDLSVDGVSDWRYVHADPYPSGSHDGHDRLVIPYRDVEGGGNTGDIEVDPHEVFPSRRLTSY